MSDFLVKISLVPIVVAKTAQPRNTDTQRELFFENLKLLGLGRQIGRKIFEALGIFERTLKNDQHYLFTVSHLFMVKCIWLLF